MKPAGLLEVLSTEAGEIPAAVQKAFLERAQFLPVDAGAQVAFENEPCGQLPFVLSGCLRVYKSAEDGRSITLYDIEPGESCVLTMSCILSGEPFPAMAEAVEKTELLLVPSADWQRWVDSVPSLRRYSHRIAARRLSSVISTLSEIAFQKISQRTARLILRRAAGTEVDATHQQIADELGTAREVVSRTLKDFERAGWIKLSRHSLMITSRKALEEAAGH